MIKKMLAVCLCLMLIACGASAAEVTFGGYSVQMPGYISYEVTENTGSNDTMLVNCGNADETVSLQIYQFDYYAMTLEQWQAYEMKFYKVTDSGMTTINGIEAAWFTADMQNGYYLVDYLLNDGVKIDEVCFWVYGEEASLEAAANMNTLTYHGSAAAEPIRLGDTRYMLALGGLMNVETTEEDAKNNIVGYYSGADFDVAIYCYEANGGTLEQILAENVRINEAGTYEMEEINGITLGKYDFTVTSGEDRYSGESWLLLEDDTVLEIVFFTSGDLSDAVDMLIKTIAVIED